MPTTTTKPSSGDETPAGSSIDPAEAARLRHELREASQALETLYAALDNVDSGLLILNKELRAVYSNPILHVMFRANSCEEIRQTRPFYADMLAAAAQAVAVDLDDYVARRLAWVQSGDPKPMDLAMIDGKALRCHLAVLPDGGRMLIYSDVTDIVRNAEELERLATTDGMTGIFNRRHFLTLADREWARARRYGRPLSCLMIDIDHFKSINDDFGHQVGDDMIVHLAKLARDCKRDCDVLARIGGEEFALLLPETDLPQALAVAERLRGEVAASSLLMASGSVRATVSIGAATSAATIDGISDLMRAADRALYEAKHGGRNRVVCHVSPDAVPSVAAPCLDPSLTAARLS
ncbi:diguanylate cyclase [Rhodopseudomonas palustris HaA2]|uniref:diguanylate cyclase n=1 Tax=Rhodopseudomonas palustris (strain HaA2) TaxID=316058 RepID=Q2IX34_RHOP2|nr:sensor domain-containing diguanylate cyclase [Rhodopseudomonas palustris]ABD07226.1 diguanylate cyclase [Rhodopseudomonas palustris HaA2]